MKNRHSFVLLVSVLLCRSVSALGPLLTLLDPQWQVGQTFVQTVEKSIKELEKRKEESQVSLTLFKERLDATRKSAALIKEEMNRLSDIDREFANQKLDILNKTIQVRAELVQTYQETQTIYAAHIKMLEEYKDDPEFTKKGFQLEQKSIYSIEDFQKVTSAVMRYDTELKTLKERLKKSATDTDTLKENLRLATREVDEKKQEQKDLREQKTDARLERKKFSLKQRGTLLDLEEHQLTNQKDLAQARLIMADAQAQLLELDVKLTSLKLDILKRQEDQVRRELRIDRKDIEAAQKELKKQIDESTELQKRLNERIEKLTLRGQEMQVKIDLAKERDSLKPAQLEQIYNWSDTPVTIPGWRTLIEIGRLHSYITYEIGVIKDILLAQVAQEKAKVTHQEVENLVITSWNSLTSGEFDGTSEALSKEIKKYEKIQSDLESSLAALADKRAAASRLLSENNRITQAIRERFKAFQEQQQTTFQTDPNLYKRFERMLKNEEKIDAQKRGEYITQLIELYSSISQLRLQTSQKIEMMLRALQSKAQSKLVPPLWNGIKKFIPDMARFILFLIEPGQLEKSVSTTQTSINSWIAGLQAQPANFLFGLLALIGLILGYLLLRIYLPDVGRILAESMPPDYGILSLVIGVIAMVIQFVAGHLTGIYLWTLGYLLIRSGNVNSYVSALYYLASIILWLYYINRFILYAKEYNRQRDYRFTSEKYHRRFFFVLSSLLSATVFIVFLRHALMRVLPQSDAPRILMALNFIIFQISIIFMISREQIYRLIPQTTTFGRWMYELVDTYYYLFLSGFIFVIVMSNPYLGYGTTFLYLILRVLMIMLLVPLIVTIHSKIKSILGMALFETDESGRMNERFPHARTGYGLLIIGSSIFFTALALLVAVNIWGFQVGITDILSVLRRDLYGYTSAETGRRVAVNALHLVRVVLYVFVGVGIAFLVNKFLLRRTFDLLMIKPGVQGIFLTLSRYIIVFAALIIGLQGIVFGTTWMIYVLAIIGGLGVAGKEILADFIGYFMILIQRPVKIGDFVRIGPELIGVVRHLTLRSVILRRKNSVTVIIPNSYVLSRPLTNWNYYRMYFAFEDIMVTVPYTADPEKVRELFLKVLDDNYEVLRNPAPVVRLDGFTENGFEFMIRGYLSHDKVLDQYDIASDIRLAVVKGLREQGYKVAVPTRILKIKKEDSPSSKVFLTSDKDE